MKIIFGLGNPGKEYEGTRHNIGFMCLNALREKLNGSEWKINKDFGSEVSEVLVHGKKALLVKPQTFVNLSGGAVQKVINFYKLTLDEILIIYDDIDLELGTIRVRPSGSAGTHNGMRSICVAIGQNFTRLRIGIESRGVTAPEHQDITSFVLHKFGKDEEEGVQNGISQAVDAVEEYLMHV